MKKLVLILILSLVPFKTAGGVVEKAEDNGAVIKIETFDVTPATGVPTPMNQTSDSQPVDTQSQTVQTVEQVTVQPASEVPPATENHNTTLSELHVDGVSKK